MDRVLIASYWAEAAHGAIGQTRGSGDNVEKYVEHCRRVAHHVHRVIPKDTDAICAALLHDVLEDTKTTAADLLQHFNERTVDLVMEVTDPKHPEGLRRAERVQINRNKLSLASPAGKIIKLCDVYDNTEFIRRDMPKFAPLYIQEKILLMAFLRGAHDALWEQVNERVMSEARIMGVV